MEAKANLEIIGRSGEHLLALINDVLDMSKIEAGRIELNPVTFSFSGLLDDLAAMFHLRADGPEIVYKVAHERGGLKLCPRSLLCFLGPPVALLTSCRLPLRGCLSANRRFS